MAGELFDLLILPALLIGGFLLMVKAYPRHRLAVGLVYFPTMLVVLLYLGLVVAWKLQRDTF